MFSHRFKMDGAFGAVIFHNRRWHVQHFWNWRVESPHEIDVSGNALHLALYLCCLATTYIVRLNLSRAAKWRNCLFREKETGKSDSECNQPKSICRVSMNLLLLLTLNFQQRLIALSFALGVASYASVLTHLRSLNVRNYEALIWNYNSVVECIRQIPSLVVRVDVARGD